MHIFYLILLILFVICSLPYLIVNFSWWLLFAQIAGFIGIGRLFLGELAKRWLRLFFLIERIKILWLSDTTSKWWFFARFDDVDDKEWENLTDNLLKNTRFKVKLEYQREFEKEFQVDGTLYIKVSFTQSNRSPFNVNHIEITSRMIEVSYGYAKRKLESQITPFLECLENLLKPQGHSSFELNIDFMEKNNPFFNLYIANLSPSQIEDFRVVLHVDGNSHRSLTDKVIISTNEMHISANSTSSFNKLAQNFILLAPDLKHLIGAKDG